VSGSIQAWSATHPGTVRTQNQDAFLSRPEIGLFAVADGVGGSGGGELASGAVVTMLSRIPEMVSPAARLASVREGLQRTHERLLGTSSPTGHAVGHAAGNAVAPATTIVVLMLHESYFACLWAGDSRAYLLRDGQLCRLTTDHSLVQDLLNAGTITEAEAEADPRQHVITRAIGAGERKLRIDKKIGQVRTGDRFLLCSDGLYKALGLETIAGLLMAPQDDAAKRLVAAALVGNARDNVTAVVAAP
jgi:protein phosphatase/serine/threonine-protein phosphatase Stp1